MRPSDDLVAAKGDTKNSTTSSINGMRYFRLIPIDGSPSLTPYGKTSC